ncbi:MAG TPA: ABC transporter permease [Gaiellaceae bacterium]|nr:ABC transporter permease [Gaiellaceae bacterium]
MNLARFLARRIALGIGVLWVVVTLVFFMYFIAPNDVARLIAGRQATPETIAAVRRNLGLDRPMLAQYLSFLSRLIHGNLGYSYTNSESVTYLIGQAFPVTLSLAIGAAILWVILGVGSGVIAARRRGSFTDRAVTGLAIFFYSIPVFLLGELLLLVLFYRLHLRGIDLFPGGGYVPLTSSPVEWARHLLLPWLTLALASAAAYSRLTRASVLEVLGQEYIRTAVAKGLPQSRVLRHHALRAALTPIATQLGLDLGLLLGGVVVTETVFGLPGLGQLLLLSIEHQDLPTTIGLVLLATTFVVVASIVVDILYALIDPRVRLG